MREDSNGKELPDLSVPVYDIYGRTSVPLYPDEEGFEKSVEYCEKLRGRSGDIIMRVFSLSSGMRCLVVMVDGMCDKAGAEENIVLAARRLAEYSDGNKFEASDGFLQQFGIIEFSAVSDLSEGYISALSGDVLCVVEGRTEAYIFGYKRVPSRSVGESPVEGAVQGPHEAFTENLRVNTALLRRRISDPNMVIENTSVGLRSHTSVAVCYIRGLTSPDTVLSILERIGNISVDIINDSGTLAQFIEDNPNGIFPQTDCTERPDVAAAELCGGRVAVIVGGSPSVLLLPATISGMMHVAEDDYQRWSFASFIRLLRWAALFIALTGSAFYVALVSYHPGLLPTDLLIISAVNRVSVPFPAITEVLILEFSLELLREASIRMPNGISGALSIVGGLIIGDAAISAGLISPLLVIIVGLSSLASFTVPSYSLASSLRLLKYMLLLLSACFGMLGLVCGLLIITSMLISARSFGTELAAPFSPADRSGIIQGLLELPAKLQITRPRFLHTLDRRRMGGVDEK